MHVKTVKLLLFFSHTQTTITYSLSLHDALPIFARAHDEHAVDRAIVLRSVRGACCRRRIASVLPRLGGADVPVARRSEEHTSELQSRRDLVCRLLLEKKKYLLLFKSHQAV